MLTVTVHTELAEVQEQHLERIALQDQVNITETQRHVAQHTEVEVWAQEVPLDLQHLEPQPIEVQEAAPEVVAQVAQEALLQEVVVIDLQVAAVVEVAEVVIEVLVVHHEALVAAREALVVHHVRHQVVLDHQEEDLAEDVLEEETKPTNQIIYKIQAR